MIADRLENSYIYKNISKHFEKSFDFINLINFETENGEYQIEEDLMAIVMEYETTANFQFGYEAHKKHIDIQYCLRGRERIKWTPLDETILIVNTPYDPEKDRAFYSGDGEGTYVDTGLGIFAIFFPGDAHAPQMYVDKPEFIKKVVVKVPVTSLL